MIEQEFVTFLITRIDTQLDQIPVSQSREQLRVYVTELQKVVGMVYGADATPRIVTRRARRKVQPNAGN